MGYMVCPSVSWIYAIHQHEMVWGERKEPRVSSRKHRFQSLNDWVWILISILLWLCDLRQPVQPSRPQFCHMLNGDNSSFCQLELLQGLNEIMLAQCLVYSKGSINSSYDTVNMMLVWLLFVTYLMWSQSTLLTLPQAAASGLLAGAWSRCGLLLPICQGESSATSGQSLQPTY